MDVTMTPTDLETYVRQRYAAIGDRFYPQSEIFTFFYDAMMQLAIETSCIQRVYTSTSVASQRAYDVPTNSLAIARIEYDGERIRPNDFKDDDSMTGNNPDESITGRTTNYQRFGDTLYFRPIPDGANTIKIYSYDMPTLPTATSTLDVPTRYHLYLADYALYGMAFQDKNFVEADRFFERWLANKRTALATERLQNSSDDFRTVKDWADQVDPRFI